MSTSKEFQKLVGKKVDTVLLRPKPDENGMKVYEPIIYFTDGSRVSFYNANDDTSGVRVSIKINGDRK